MGSPLNLSFAAFKRSLFPEAVTVNCLVERDPTNPNAPLVLISRPGLEAFATVGTAPIRAIWQKAGLFANAALIVASGVVYTLDSSGATVTYTGVSVAGDDLVDIDGGLDADLNSIARIATGDAMYKVADDGTVVQEDFPVSGGAGATSVGFLAGYWLGVEAGTDAIYYQIPAASTWNALQFASAEYAPDKIVALVVAGEVAWFGGEATLEGWRATGNASSPLEPYGGLKFDIGCLTRNAAINCRGTFVFVDSDCSVRMTSGGEPKVISDNGLAEQIRRTPVADIRASFYLKDQHPCYVLTLGSDATWIYDLSSQAWTRANSDGYAFWRAHLFCNIGDTVLAADALSNQVWRMDPDRYTDGSDTFTKEFTAFLSIPEGAVGLGNIEVTMTTGFSPRTGQGSDPLVGMQLARDGGRTWGPERFRGLGLTGQYNKRVRWNGCGMATAPNGLMAKFYVSDPVGFRVSAVRANVA